MWEPSTDSATQSWGAHWRRAAAQQALGTGAGGDVGPAAHRGGAEGGLVGGYVESAVDGFVQAVGAGTCVGHHAVQGGQQLVSGQSQVQRHDGWDERAGQGRTPMRNFLVPHSVQVDRVAGRPFFMVTASMSFEPVLALHLTQ